MNCEKCGALLDESGKCPSCGSIAHTVANNQIQNYSNPQKKHRGQAIIAIILALIIALGGCTCALVYFEAAYIPGLSLLLNKNAENYSNNDTVYHPAEEALTYDAENNVIYFNNMLTVYTFSDLSRADAEKLAKSVDGKIVGDISGCVNALQIRVDEATFDELNEKSEILMSDDSVLYAGHDYPISISNTAISDPWTDDSENPESDRGNEKKPNGNDWWAEAIGAYTAWGNAKNTKKIKVGIIDNGFDSDHEDLRDSISFLPDYTEISEGYHGTHVAGLIGAKNNSIGIRGVADNAELICCDWNPREGVNYLSSGEFMEIMKQMIESGVRVINNSWGQETQSKEAFVNDFTSAIKKEKKAANANSIIKQYILEYSINNKNVEAAVDKTELYEKYLSYSKYVSEMQGISCILLLVEVILSGKDDFLIVQAAGNGYDHNLLKDGIDTIYNGAFCAVGENVFNKLSESTRKKLSGVGITYKKIKDHIIIVGAVENKKDKKGNYQMTTWSNYGNNIDICAPGLNVYSTLFNDTYGCFSGTSIAAPIVSGATALLWSCDMTKSAAEIKKELIESCTVKAIGVGNGKGKTYPMLNIGKAIKRQNKTASSAVNYEDFEEMMDFVFESGFLKNFDIKNLNIESILNMLQAQLGIPTGEILRLFYKYRYDIEAFIEWIMEYIEEFG